MELFYLFPLIGRFVKQSCKLLPMSLAPAEQVASGSPLKEGAAIGYLTDG
jgi:hypothetical protein